MVLESSSPIDIDLTLNSGQFFHWHRKESSTGRRNNGKPRFVLLHRTTAITLTQISPRVLGIDMRGTQLNQKEVRALTGLHIDRETMHEVLTRKTWLAPLLREYTGLTILAQDPYECLISFMTSGMSNIPRIMKNLAALRRALGSPIADTQYHALPPAEVISGAGENTLRNLGFGYRGKFIAETCKELTILDVNLNTWRRLSDREIKERLMALPGIGQKISECVLLFGFGRLTAFPVDVWVKRALERLWPEHFGWSADRWTEWAKNRWGGTSGYVQQILFLASRNGILAK